MTTVQETLPISVDSEGKATLGVGANQHATRSIDTAAATAVELPFDDDLDDGDSRRRDRVRARTISIKRLSKRELERGRQLYPESDYQRPMARSECSQGEYADRPCPFVSCKYHLYLDVSERTGAIKCGSCPSPARSTSRTAAGSPSKRWASS